jgi:phthalate 4,5-dioxygenase oxygenase subunit
MLSKEDNITLCQVGPGTLMGNLLRRYWTPALLSSELPEPDSPPIRVRLLGEDLVAFRDSSGRVGFFTQACPHRGASMFFGRNEEDGLRCVYHGWKFDVSGACVDMPSEPAESNFKSKVRIRAYDTHESGGIVWTYMGPKETQPRFRDLGTEAIAEDQARAAKQLTYCNWIQALEGNIDTSHISWLHQYTDLLDTPGDGTDRPGYPSQATSWWLWAMDRSPRLELQDTEYGFRYAGIRTTPNGNTHVRVTAYIMPYQTIVAGLPVRAGGTTFVPRDDETCWRFSISSGMLKGRFTYEGQQPGGTPYKYPYGGPDGAGMRGGVIERKWRPDNDYQINRELQKTSLFTGIENFVSQDLMATESMGPIYDRTQEHLGSTDRAIIRMRQILLKAARDLARGIEPPVTHPTPELARIYSAEKILAPGEDWRYLGTSADPMVAQMEKAPEEIAATIAGG